MAWATFLCQGVSCILSIIVVFRHLSSLKTDKKSAPFSWSIFKSICVVAIPSILQQSFISLGNIVIQSVINGFGASVIAGYAASVKLNNMVITSFTTLGNGISNFTSQNIGAGKHSRVHEGFRAGCKMVWMLCIPIVALYLLGGKWLVFLFMEDAQGPALTTGVQMLRILSPFYFVISIKLVADGILRGASLMRQFMVSTFTDLILRVILAIFLSKELGTIGIWMAWPIGWAIGTSLSVLLYKKSLQP